MTEDLDKKQLVRNLGEHYTSVFEEVIRDVLTSYRPWFAHKVAQRLKGLELGSVSAESVSEAQDWQGIESMSRLRSVVGGRFQNLKEKWLNAGFPLRAHRGDRKADFDLKQEGWVELSSWIVKQGYEVRLTPEHDTCLFEVRSLG